MTDSFKELLSILSKNAFGNNASIHINDTNLYESAIKQGVLPMVYGTMLINDSNNKKYENLFYMQIVQRERMLCCLKAVVNLLNSNNISYYLLKGFAIGELYYKPEYRISGDIDILIDEKSESKVAKLLSSQLGMQIYPRSKSHHHFSAKLSGIVLEIHVCLYSSVFDDIVLKNKFSITEPPVMIKINNEFYVNTLGLYDNLYFLTIHLIKHFVKEGCGIRQIIDLLVYVNTYKEKIDFEKYFDILETLKFDKLIKNILGIGVKYCDLSFSVYETEYSDDILTDIENGGNFGFSDSERQGFFNNFIESRAIKNRKAFVFERSLQQTKNILKGVFLPSKTFLINKGYKYLEKSILLYPIAYINRIKDAMIMLRGRGTKDFKFNTNENQAINNRMELMKELHMIN